VLLPLLLLQLLSSLWVLRIAQLLLCWVMGIAQPLRWLLHPMLLLRWWLLDSLLLLLLLLL